MAQGDEAWLALDEAASKPRVSSMTVYRMIDSGQVPHIQPNKLDGGASIRNPELAIRDLMEESNNR